MAHIAHDADDFPPRTIEGNPLAEGIAGEVKVGQTLGNHRHRGRIGVVAGRETASGHEGNFHGAKVIGRHHATAGL